MVGFTTHITCAVPGCIAHRFRCRELNSSDAVGLIEASRAHARVNCELDRTERLEHLGSVEKTSLRTGTGIYSRFQEHRFTQDGFLVDHLGWFALFGGIERGSAGNHDQ